jgi:hypothetical protein
MWACLEEFDGALPAMVFQRRNRSALKRVEKPRTR